jgi:hypothetical protein
MALASEAAAAAKSGKFGQLIPWGDPVRAWRRQLFRRALSVWVGSAVAALTQHSQPRRPLAWRRLLSLAALAQHPAAALELRR